MAFNTGSHPTPSLANKTSFGPSTSANSSLFIEKTKANLRRSTPDSEALASSDDEQEQSHRGAHTTNQQAHRTTRRPSWRSDNAYDSIRKASFSGGESFSPTSSQTTSVGSDANTWASSGSALGRGLPGSSPFPWGNTIWNNDTQKAPPSRLAEVLPSPTSQGPTSFLEDPGNSPPLRRDSSSDAAIPFAIPLQPTLKTYRSQSYSVGQLDQESMASMPARQVQHGYSGRTRVGSSYVGLQHRPSRPSMLGDFSPDTSVLEQLREVEDDDEESTTSSEAGVRLSSTQARTIEQLAMENAILRQQARVHQSSGISTNLLYNPQASVITRPGERSLHVNDSVLEELDEISAGTEEQSFGNVQNNNNRYFSAVPAENRAVESVKKGHWQSSLGFGGVVDIPQSRRHSFADVPIRHPSVSSAVDAQESVKDSHAMSVKGSGLSRQTSAENVSYFSNSLSRNMDIYRPSSSSSSIHQSYGMQQQHQHRMSHFGHNPPLQGQLLYLVTFKAARAEFYYVQEGTGLEVNTGDLVIVEADRGTDLGTVAHKNVDWASARELKERYIAEHYNWLMMFSRLGQNAQNVTTSSPNVAPLASRPQNSAIGGMGPPGPPSPAESSSVEIKPKMIKRLAQTHEIHMLREKEGNEAKAKRMCQQKVAEHHLNMEILDAEFQMDWKKLTFYYFAEAYVNFNSLVTDLFKIYKTRIWMSAINPASFMSPTASLQLSTSIIGAPAPDHEQYHETRLKMDNRFPLPEVSQGLNDYAWNVSQPGPISMPANPQGHSHFFPVQSHGASLSSIGSPNYGRGGYPTLRAQSPYGLQSYNLGNGPRRSPHSSSEFKDDFANSSYPDQVRAMQGLSLGT